MTATPELNKAVAAFQAELPRVAKGNTADTGTYKYDYADLEDVAAKVLPLLGKHGLAFIAVPTIRDDGLRVLEYALVHASGEERGGQYPLPDKVTAQQMGSAITYARRYCLLAVTGVAPGGDDDDGAAANQAPAQQRPRVYDGTHDTPWTNPAEPGGRNRLREIGGRFKDLGITDRGVRLGYVQTLLGRELAKAADMTQDEQRDLLDLLATCETSDDLDQLRDKAMEARA